MGLQKLLLICAFALIAGSARADDCGPLKLITSVQLEPIDDRFMVPVTINGSARRLLLDTGGFISQLSRSAVQSLQLQDHPSILEMYDVAGNRSDRFVTLKELVLGSMRAQNLQMPVFPDPQLGMAHGYDGILSSNLLIAYDVDIDFGTGKMNYFSPDHCPGKVLYWTAPAVAVVPITIQDESRIMVPVTLDGHNFRVFIDTGAANTVMSLPVAERLFGLAPNSPGMIAFPNANDKTLTSYGYVFHSLTFGDISVHNPHVVLIPDVMNRNGDKSQQTANRALLNNADITLPELTLGMDVMKKLHVYMAFHERRLYITPASSPPSGSAKPAP